MNRIEEMIKRLCPKGVERVSVGDIIKYLPGGSLNRNQVKQEGLYPVMNGGVDYSGYYDKFNYDGNVLTISHWGSSAGHVHIHHNKFWANNACWVFIPQNSATCSLNILYYLLKNKEELMSTKYCFGGATPNLNRKLFENMQIPLPPLSIQQEIVSVLDSFTTLIDKMKKEVEMRKKQMECYRERLMSPKEGWTVKTLGEIGTFTRGSGLQKSDLRDAGFPCIHYGQIHTFYNFAAYKTKSFCNENYAKKLKKGKTGDLLIATTSEDVEACCKAVAWLGDSEVAYSTDSYCYSHDQDPKFMAYLFQTEMFAKQKRMAATGAKVVRVSGEAMATFSFALPPLSKQREIARTLDIFEEYIQRLEKLISLRQKQYEYYRERLLTFE